MNLYDVPGIAIVQAVADRVYRELQGRIGNLDYDDLIQAGWLAMDRARSRPWFDPACPGAQSYLGRAVRNDLLRLIDANTGPCRLPHESRLKAETAEKRYRARVTRPLLDRHCTPDPIPELIDKMDAAETADRVWGLLPCLAKRERDTVSLYYFYGVNDEKIAARRGVKRQAVQHVRRTAMEKIRERIAA